MYHQARIRNLIEEIVYDINEEMGLKVTFEQAEEAIVSQFRVMKDTMKDVELDNPKTHTNVRLPYIGNFYVAPSRIKYITKYGKEKDKL